MHATRDTLLVTERNLGSGRVMRRVSQSIETVIILGGSDERRAMSWGQSVMLVCILVGLAVPLAAQVDQQRAEAYFKEAATICQRDGGRLWGISL